MKKISKLGFGLMRLPRQQEQFDEPQICKMIDMYLEAGGNYFDTAWLYQGNEEIMKKTLIDRHQRDKYLIATKLAAWMNCKTREDAIGQFNTSLQRSGAGYFDYYLLHNLGEKRTELAENWGLWDFVQEKKAAGLVKHIGFSFHSTADELESILIAHPEAEFVQLQINYADWDDKRVQSERCYKVARKYNKCVIIMEPVKGGMLANPPAGIDKLFKAAAPDMSCASWAIRFAASLDGVMTVLSGMSSIEQVADNLSFMRDFKALDANELQIIRKAQQILQSLPVVPCTFCNYCAKACPENIGISGTFDALNMLNLYGDFEFASNRERFSVTVQGKNRASKCIRCGKCEKVCPQHIEIRKYLAEAVEKLKMK